MFQPLDVIVYFIAISYSKLKSHRTKNLVDLLKGHGLFDISTIIVAGKNSL